jgi:hypothetical protein
MPNSAKPDSSLVRQNNSARPLVINTEVETNSNHMRSRSGSERVSPLPTSKVRSPFERLPMGASLVITTQVKSKTKTLPSSALTSEISSKDKHYNIQPQDVKSKVQLSHSTNARSLASWVDEFCQGTEWEREDNIFI